MEKTPRILIVDDEPSVRQSMEIIFAGAGYITASAKNGAEALAMYQTADFDLVVTDQWMPGMRGEQLASAIKQLNHSTPIVLVSGTPPLPAPPIFDSVLLKPFDLEAIRSSVARSLQRR